MAATGHLNSVQTIHRTLANKSSLEKPSYWVQISGGSALAAAELDDPSRPAGTGSSIIWDDLGGIDAIRSLIKNHPKRAVDNHMLLATADTPNVKTAVVMPPIIYGQGRGPVNQRSVQIPELAKLTLQRRRGVQVGPGESRWSDVHIRDLSQLLLRLVEKAAEGSQEKDVWGPKALYLAGLGELVSDPFHVHTSWRIYNRAQTFGDISRRVAAAAEDLKLVSDTSIEEISGPEADQLLPHGSVLYGTNARVQANRAQEFLGWKRTHESLEQDIPRTVASEARDLGLIGEKDSAAHL